MFLTRLRAEKVEDSTWMIVTPLIYSSDILDDVITVPADFETDFASVPRLPLAFLLTGDSAHAAAVVHDWLYEKQQYTRAICDLVFEEACVAAGEPKWRATLMWIGVRLGGWIPWNNKRG